MKNVAIFTLITLLGLSAFAMPRKGTWSSLTRTADSLDTFLGTAVNADGTLADDFGHEAAANAMFANLQRKFEGVLATDIIGMTAEEQMDFFTAVGDTLTTMGNIAAWADLLQYDTISHGMQDLRTAYGLAATTWATGRVDNELVKVPTLADTYDFGYIDGGTRCVVMPDGTTLCGQVMRP